jgi:hypothetical protein
MHNTTYLGAFAARFEFPNSARIDVSVLVDHEVRVASTQRGKGPFTVECRDKLGLDFSVVSVVVKGVFP